VHVELTSSHTNIIQIPDIDTEKALSPLKDIFGRSRHSTDRDDMGGTGTFTRDNRTLFIAGLLNGPDLYELLNRVCAEWGEIEVIRVKQDRLIAFVDFKMRSSAEFAKEALLGQDAGNGEVLNVKWASEDPNPKAKAERKARYEAMLLEAAEKKAKDLEYRTWYAEYMSWHRSEEKRIAKENAESERANDPGAALEGVKDSGQVTDILASQQTEVLARLVAAGGGGSSSSYGALPPPSKKARVGSAGGLSLGYDDDSD